MFSSNSSYLSSARTCGRKRSFLSAMPSLGSLRKVISSCLATHVNAYPNTGLDESALNTATIRNLRSSVNTQQAEHVWKSYSLYVAN